MPSESRGPSVLTVSLVLVIVVSGAVCSTRIFAVCRPGHEFWSTEKSACHPCTKCAPAFTLSPCAVHKDAVCGPLSALELDWSFLATRRKPEMADQRTTDALISEMLWRFPNLDERPPKSTEFDGKIRCDEKTGIKTTRNVNDQNGFPIADHLQLESIVDSEQGRASGESGFLWDWQTGALLLAICACVVFFLVAGCSALIYVRQWRRMKRNFEPAGLEEISARLNLMVKAELSELTAAGPKTPGDPRCQYLENLLDRNRETSTVGTGWPETSGNLYIDERTTPRAKRVQIARIHRNIERVLSHKTNRG